MTTALKYIGIIGLALICSWAIAERGTIKLIAKALLRGGKP